MKIMKLIPFNILAEKKIFSLKNIVVSIFALSVLVSCGGKQNDNS